MCLGPGLAGSSKAWGSVSSFCHPLGAGWALGLGRRPPYEDIEGLSCPFTQQPLRAAKEGPSRGRGTLFNRKGPGTFELVLSQQSVSVPSVIGSDASACCWDVHLKDLPMPTLSPILWESLVPS